MVINLLAATDGSRTSEEQCLESYLLPFLLPSACYAEFLNYNWEGYLALNSESSCVLQIYFEQEKTNNPF